jgi:hypothetical protein
MDQVAKVTLGAGSCGGGGDMASDFDIVNAVEDYSGSTWIPTSAVTGKAFKVTRRPQVWTHQHVLLNHYVTTL